MNGTMNRTMKEMMTPVMQSAGNTISRKSVVCDAIEAGVVLITCNNGDEILEILRKKGYHA